ncbi:MAG: carboxylating nicotinate-nucleotide diphosphorylase [Desulfobulbus sp.]|jgi:nicotinate-nucleotide pyrophosphorylase (carboxylating)|uniref:carboxylating nicotinate-nucleotide diphosphorylase n=1 Tax=Desulfobulbus sp. TaxID=895 RepID=UPI00284259DA|nr:carboxylating nicotinate-nucleotide diphosphorylase [Desulfobulbus sp.]MDR2549014.1 carboxylating nicotinate-nucleotide diphosphorylase [Desulfobulbus sp.]
MDTFLLDPLLHRFLAEDLEHGDITTEAIFSPSDRARACFISREPMTVVGLETVAARVFRLLDPNVACTGAVADGSRVEQGEVLLRLSGATRTLLRGERVALNLAQRLCGIATLASAFADAVKHTKAEIVDTRKTTPGLRLLEKYAVRASGGAHNHRYSLSDGVLIKDNHIAACGSITEAVRRVRARVPHTINVEVETDTLAQVEECLACKVGVIMLDNMDPTTLRQAVATIAGRAIVEASGGVNLDTVRGIAEAGVDIISVGALTHSARACDIGMDWRE